MSTTLPNLEQLNDHSFILRITEDNTPLMNVDMQLEGDQDTPKNRFIFDTGYYVGQLMNQTSRIDQAAVLMNSYPRIVTWRQRYGRFEYFQYHMEAYMISLSGLVDRLLLLTNHLYDLGIADRNVRFNGVTKKLNEQMYGDVAAGLQTIQGAMRDVKTSKNQYTHAIRFWEKKLWHIGVLEWTLKNVHKGNVDLQSDLDFDTKLYLREKMDLIAQNEKAVLKLVGKFYNRVNEQYVTRLSKY